MFIRGGGYIGNKGNNFVRKMEAYVDTWWSRDGRYWHKVNYKESKGATLYSSQEWSKTTVSGSDFQIGKWGMTVEYFQKDEDLNGDGEVKDLDPGPAGRVGFDFGSPADASTNEVKFWRRVSASEKGIPALFFIGGDTVDQGSLVSDVFVSLPGILCELDGVSCSGRGFCGPGVTGCVCSSLQYVGEYCEKFNDMFVSGAWTVRPWTAINAAVVLGGVLWSVVAATGGKNTCSV